MPMSGWSKCHDHAVVVEPDRAEIRRRGMSCLRNLRPAGLGILMLLFSACSGPHDTADTTASCVGPYLSDQPPSGSFRGPVPTVDPGATITIYGHWYTSTCNDIGGVDDPLRPLPPVHLTLSLPGGAVEELGEFSPKGQDMGFSTAVHVPAGTPAGTATVSDDQQYQRVYKFKIGE
jgi:hypothetical protein